VLLRAIRLFMVISFPTSYPEEYANRLRQRPQWRAKAPYWLRNVSLHLPSGLRNCQRSLIAVNVWHWALAAIPSTDVVSGYLTSYPGPTLLV